MSKVSIISITYKNNKMTKEFLDSMFEHTNVYDIAEVIIVNNDPNTDFIYKHDKVVVVSPNKNLGFSGGNNFGVKYATGNYLLFINNDVLFHDDGWLQGYIEQKDADKNTIIGHEVIKNNSLTTYKDKPRTYIGGWCVFMSKEDFDLVGGWDEDFGVGFFEDVYMSQKFLQNGYSLIEKKVGIQHLGSKSFSKLNNLGEITNINRLVYLNKMRFLKKDKIRIVFYYNGEFDFNDSDYMGKGVGGSESALILLTRELAKLNYEVEVYNNTSVEGEFNGVIYKNTRSFNPLEYCDLFILYRDSYPDLQNVMAKAKIFFSCDQVTSGDWNFDVFPYIDKMICISEFHKDYVVNTYNIKRDDIVVLPLGVNGPEYVEPLVKEKNKMIFCSVPHRGLKYMVKAFPIIKEKIPSASLYITSDYRLWGSEDPDNHEYVDKFNKMKDVFFLGKIPRKDLVYHQKTSEIMSYPCDYDENFCLSALECMASGSVPVTFGVGAIPETVGDCGVVMPGRPREKSNSSSRFAQAVIKLLNDRKMLDFYCTKGRARVLAEYSWEVLVHDYIGLFMEILSKKGGISMVKCDVCNKEFNYAFDMIKHKVEKHKPKPVTTVYDAPKNVFVRIRTTKKVKVSVGKRSWSGDEFDVPKNQSYDIIRILKEGYGEDILRSVSTMSN